ncbi:MAG: ATP-binding protein [Chlorobiaceae bacterium]|nr:ATP-binding protein [Chlorobiaceae bacterium]
MNIYRIAFCGSITRCGELRGCVNTVCRIEGYSEKFIPVLELAVHEAFVNAVLHGNKECPDGPVSVVFRCRQSVSGRSLQVDVADCGKGFDLKKLDTPADDDESSALNGRGLRIIRHFAESIDIGTSSDGSVLSLHYIPF